VLNVVCDAVGRVIQTLPEREPVWGLTSLKDRLYVLRGLKSEEQIEVYDIGSYRLMQCINVPGLGHNDADHVTHLLHELHWLKVPERVQFRLCVLAYRCLH